ncbi:MAG: lysophospholipid acyltransferase family protein [Planctomycetota bacterium]
MALPLLFRIRAWGVEHVPPTGGALLASNHQSFLDPTLVGTPLGRQVYYMARRSLFEVPGLGAYLRSLKAFPVERGGVDRRALRQAVTLMRAGQALVVFPEGTRSPGGGVQRFRAGFALLAAQAGVPIVPVAIDGAFEAWPRHRAFPWFGRVRVAYGEALPPLGEGKDERRQAAAEVRRRVVALQEQLRATR